MKRTLATFAVLSLAAFSSAAFADHDRDGDRRFAFDDLGVWVGGHFEIRETKRVIPAVVRQEWVPERREEVCIPAVTEKVCVPAVTERVYVPAVVQRREIPEVRERQFVPGHYEFSVDFRGCSFRVWIEGHYETRVVSPARCEQVQISAARYEVRVVVPAHDEIRVVVPERRECRVVEAGHFCTVVVSPERTEVCRDKVWVPGHWETRRDRC